MKKGRLAILALVLFIFGCQKDDSDFVSPQNNVSVNQLTAFTFLKAVNPDLTGDIVGTIADRKIILNTPSGLSFNKLVASFTSSTPSKVYIGDTEQTSGVTVNNFSAPVVYRIIAPDGSANFYKVELNSVFPELDQALEKVMQQYNVPGISVAIVKNDKLLFA